MRKNANHELLIAGARDFLKASAAIANFGDQVYKAAVTVLRKREKELKAAAGIQVNTNKIRDYPKEGYIFSGQDGTEATIGPVLPLPDWNSFNLYVWWRISDHRAGQQLCSVVASVVCKTTGSAEAVCEALRTRSRGRVKKDGNAYEVWIEKLLKPEDFVRLEPQFDELVRDWIAYCKCIGGLKKYLKC